VIEMERTGKDKSSVPVSRKKKKKSAHAPVEIVQGRFYDELRFAETQELHLEFDTLVRQIHEVGERFGRNPTIALLKQYKSMIRDFLAHVTDNMYRVEKHTGGRLRQKIYTVAKIIDQKLESITELVISQQAGHIDLLSTLDEIRGMLIDLYK
jgi:uncharacterized protein YaaR (DUF327 family)